jgi:hypothetical protein
MSTDDLHDPHTCGCSMPLHNLLVCCGPVCVPACPTYQWAERHGLITKEDSRR